MAEGADHRHARFTAKLLDPVGARCVDAEYGHNGGYINALSFYCGFHDVCLDPVKNEFLPLRSV
jgi:hypothetical protein